MMKYRSAVRGLLFPANARSNIAARQLRFHRHLKCLLILGSPIDSHSSSLASPKARLLVRQVGAYTGLDTLNSSQGVTFYSYRGGTWVAHTTITFSIKYACRNAIPV